MISIVMVQITMINVQKRLFFERNWLFQSSLVWPRHMLCVAVICLNVPVQSIWNTQMLKTERIKSSIYHTLHSVPQRMTHNDPLQQLKELSCFPWEHMSDELTLVSSHVMRLCGSLWAHNIVELSTRSTSVRYRDYIQTTVQSTATDKDSLP